MRVFYYRLWHFLQHVLVFYATSTGTWQLPFTVCVCVDSIQFACALDDLSCRCACTYLCVCFRFFLPICISLLRLRQSSTKNCYRSRRRRRRRCCYCCCDCVCIQSSMSFCILHISLGSSEEENLLQQLLLVVSTLLADTPPRRASVSYLSASPTPCCTLLGHNWSPHASSSRAALIGKSNRKSFDLLIDCQSDFRLLDLAAN